MQSQGLSGPRRRHLLVGPPFAVPTPARRQAGRTAPDPVAKGQRSAPHLVAQVRAGVTLEKGMLVERYLIRTEDGSGHAQHWPYSTRVAGTLRGQRRNMTHRRGVQWPPGDLDAGQGSQDQTDSWSGVGGLVREAPDVVGLIDWIEERDPRWNESVVDDCGLRIGVVQPYDHRWHSIQLPRQSALWRRLHPKRRNRGPRRASGQHAGLHHEAGCHPKLVREVPVTPQRPSRGRQPLQAGPARADGGAVVRHTAAGGTSNRAPVRRGHGWLLPSRST